MPLNLAFSLCVQTILLHSQIVLFCGLGTRKNATEWASPPGGDFFYAFISCRMSEEAVELFME